MENFKKSLVVTAFISLSVVGCGNLRTNQFQSLQEPTDGPTARVRAVIKYASLVATPDSDCYEPSARSGLVIGGTFMTASGHKGKKIGIPPGLVDKSTDPSDIAEFYVSGEKPITFLQQDMGGAYSCRLNEVTFTPETNKDYEIEYFHDMRARRCSVRLWSLTDNKNIPLKNTGSCKSKS